MLEVNPNYLKLPGSYLFSKIAARVNEYKHKHVGAEVISLGIGDVTRPLTPSVIRALHTAVDDMADERTFHGYGPELGYAFLRDKICESEYTARNCEITADEIFISDGSKSDCGNIQEIFASTCRIAVSDPVYPVYIDSNVMANRTGTYDPVTSLWSDVCYMPCTAEHDFVPELPEHKVDLIYLCSPNNPTGKALSKDVLQSFVDYALTNRAIILFDAAYEAYISEPDIPHSIYECPGATQCAIELRSFSKNAGFTGVRLGYSVVPKTLRDEHGHQLHPLWARHQTTKFNGTSYIQQRAGQALYTIQGQKEIRSLVSYYMKNAHTIRDSLQGAGYRVYGGVNAPYLFVATPKGMSSFDFFDYLLENAQVVGTPGCGFGPCGEGYLRLTAFGSHESTQQAVAKILAMSL